MPQSISPDIIRICKVCGEEFHPTARKQACCNQMKPRKCAVCGKEFMTLCSTSNTKSTCSTECTKRYADIRRSQAFQATTRVCKWCGKEFHPKSVRQFYCEDVHYQTCAVCGKKFVINPANDDTVKTCSSECRYKLMIENTDREQSVANQKAVILEKYGVENIMQIPGVVDKIRQSNLEKYGSEWYTQTEEYKKRVEETDLAKYGVKHHLQSQVVIDKRIDTVQEKYGSTNIFSSDYGKAKVRQSLKQKYGVINPSQDPKMKAKATKNSRRSKLEDRICNLLTNYGIEFIHHHVISNGQFSHEFDFYIPKYKLLIDADGLYFHSYLDDPDGERVRDDYDEVRLHLVPKDHIFHVIIENNEDKQIKDLVQTLESVAEDLSEYDSIIFKWCRSIGFPYPKYDDKRLLSDWEHLKNYHNDKYVPQCRIGLSSIKQFHRSIYACHVGKNPSPLEAWKDDEMVKQVIRNRFIYKNNIDPSKILTGFNISKICPFVSIFNPILARYLTLKYLSEFSTVFDPFSGFSGRMLGVSSTDKKYLGQDLNNRVVNESNQILSFLKIDSATVISKDVLESSGEYECLLTCPPYNKKEIYNAETEFKDCDGWIYECLKRFNCKRYVFVIDKTEVYSNYVTETISNESHLNSTSEYVVVIDSEDRESLISL